MTLIRRIEFSRSNTGAFGTLITGERNFRFDYQNTFGPPPVMETWTNGANASSSWDSTLRVQKLVLTSGATNGQFARYVSTYPIPYTPGHGNELSVTFTPCLAAVNNTQFTVGIMSPRDGMAFRVKNGSGLFFVNRSYITGAAVDTEVASASWLYDGATWANSGFTLDPAKSQILKIDFQSLQTGSVRFGFNHNGAVLWAHQTDNDNVRAGPYITNPNMYLWYELAATGTTAADCTAHAICGTVHSQGGGSLFEIPGYPRAYVGSTTGIGVTTRRPIFSLRPKATYGTGSPPNTALVFPDYFDVTLQTNNATLEVVRNGTLTGAAFASYASNSVAEVDVTATAISGGDVIGAFNGLSGSGSAKNDASAIIERTLLACNAAATRQDTISLVATSFTGTSTITVIAGWKEVY